MKRFTGVHMELEFHTVLAPRSMHNDMLLLLGNSKLMTRSANRSLRFSTPLGPKHPGQRTTRPPQPIFEAQV